MTLPVKLAVPHRQSHLCHKLARYCRALDGTEVELIPISEAEDRVTQAKQTHKNFASLQASGLRKVALLSRGKPFIWLEPDSIPLKPGWAAALSNEYANCGRPYLLSADTHPPLDIVGGIGVYGPDTYWQIPDEFATAGWDLWMLRHIPQLIARTHSIQHKYAEFFQGHLATLRGEAIRASLRDDALIYHRDKYQDLIPHSHPTVHHTGEMGDLIAALPIFRHMGGVHLTIGNHTIPGWRRMSDGGWPAIKPLLDTISYIKSATWTAQPYVHAIDMTHWRSAYKIDRSLTANQADFLGYQPDRIDMSPWIKVTPASASTLPLAIARSARYQNPAFPWRTYLSGTFVGTEDEHKNFCTEFGKVPYRKTKDMLALARLLAGARAFVGNQSSPWWLARALGIETTQETHAFIHDSIIGAPNAHYFL